MKESSRVNVLIRKVEIESDDEELNIEISYGNGVKTKNTVIGSDGKNITLTKDVTVIPYEDEIKIREDDVISFILIKNSPAKKVSIEAEAVWQLYFHNTRQLESLECAVNISTLSIKHTKITNLRGIDANTVTLLNNNVKAGGVSTDIPKVMFAEPVERILAFAGNEVSVYEAIGDKPNNLIAAFTKEHTVFRTKLALIQQGKKSIARF